MLAKDVLFDLKDRKNGKDHHSDRITFILIRILIFQAISVH